MKVGILIKPIIAQHAGIHQFTAQLVKGLERFGSKDYFLVGSEKVDSALPQLTIPAYAENYLDSRRWLLKTKNPGLDWIVDPSHLASYRLFNGANKCTIIHDLTPVRFPQYHRTASVLGHRLFLKSALEQSRAIIAISQQTEQDLKEFLPTDQHSKIHQIYPGFQAPSQHLQAVSLPTERFFLSVGTAEPRKNLGNLIQAFEKFVDAGKGEECLVIVGPKGWKEPLEQRIKESSARERIIHLGFVKPEELQWLYANARALVYVSLYEGFGFPILEAMKAGCPVITSARGSMAEIANSHALTVQPEEVESIVHAMNRASEDNGLRLSLIEKGRNRQADFGWDRFIHKLEDSVFSQR